MSKICSGHKWLVRSALVGLLFGASVGCKPQEHPTDESAVTGVAYPFRHYVNSMVDQPRMLREVGEALHKNMLRALARGRATLPANVTPRQLLGAEIIRLLLDNPFLLQRQQLTLILSKLVGQGGSGAAHCAGVPCTRILGFKPNEAEQVIDEVLGRVTGSERAFEDMGLVKRNALLYGLSAKLSVRQLQDAVMFNLFGRQREYQYVFERDLRRTTMLTVDTEMMIKQDNGPNIFGELKRLPNLKILGLRAIWQRDELLKDLIAEPSFSSKVTSAKIVVFPMYTQLLGKDEQIVAKVLQLPKLNHLTLQVGSLKDIRTLKVPDLPPRIKSVLIEVRGPEGKELPQLEWSLEPFFRGPEERRPRVEFVYGVEPDFRTMAPDLVLER